MILKAGAIDKLLNDKLRVQLKDVEATCPSVVSRLHLCFDRLYLCLDRL